MLQHSTVCPALAPVLFSVTRRVIVEIQGRTQRNIAAAAAVVGGGGSFENIFRCVYTLFYDFQKRNLQYISLSIDSGNFVSKIFKLITLRPFWYEFVILKKSYNRVRFRGGGEVEPSKYPPGSAPVKII